VLNDSIGAAERAEQYRQGGARALSVLTEPSEFGGSNDDVSGARVASGLPILKKDFHVAPSQVWEAQSLGASAILLIARALGPAGLRDMLREVEDAGLEALVEIRSEAELEWALECDATVVGVNCRDLETLRLEPDVHERLIPRIPASRVAVAESGIHGAEDVAKLALIGADAVLVGSALSTSGNAVEAVRSLCGVRRRSRAT
jgi:indole-3-glycerol phosphate synthase